MPAASRSRLIPVVLALTAAVSFALAVQAAWWSAGEVSIGPFGSRSCFSGDCRESGLSRFGGSDLWLRSATATRAAGYIAMFVLLMFAGALAAKREPKLVARGAISAILTAAAVGAYFAAASPSIEGTTMSYGVFLYAGAVGVGVAAIVLYLRQRR
jgi:hypothetical protein